MLDYDKKFLTRSSDNLTFDGSSIRGFTPQRESDLRLSLDWGAFYWAPADIFGPGKVLVFGDVYRPRRWAVRGRRSRSAQDLRQRQFDEGRLHAQRRQRNRRLPLRRTRRRTALSRNRQVRVRQYRRLLPLAPRRPAAHFIDTVAEVQRAMGFQNEKDHPEVAPSQFEINYGYGEVVAAADQIQLYKLICRQVATQARDDRELLAQAGRRRERQRHAHQRVGSKDGKNLFWDAHRARASERLRLGVHRPDSDPRQGPLLDAQLRASTRTAGSIRTSKRPTRSKRRRSIAAR